jgi:hypothetical protein
MPHLSLDTIAVHLLEPLARSQEDLKRAISAQVARGKPIEKTALAAALHLSLEELEQRLVRLPDLEYDQQGHIVGWGITLVPTRHRFQIHGQQSLFFRSEEAASRWMALHPEVVLHAARASGDSRANGRPDVAARRSCITTKARSIRLAQRAARMNTPDRHSGFQPDTS